MQMMCAGVYSHFASRNLNTVVNLSEKQKLMTNICILEARGTE